MYVVFVGVNLLMMVDREDRGGLNIGGGCR